MKKIYSMILCLALGVNSFLQTTDLGGPFAWRTKTTLPKNIDTKIMPGYDAVQVAEEDAINDAEKENAWRFGYKYETDFSLINSGTWTDLPNGNRLWQIELVCENALTINLILSDLFLPEGANIYMYDKNNTNRVGAYTSRNNGPDGMLGTELVHGDHIVVEYFEPAAFAGQGHFTIANVIHGYRSLTHVQKDLTKALEDSGDCNIDVNCPLGIGWEDQINSVAMIVVGGNGICTGALINNTCSDGTPYFLTANHCLGGETTWAFRFNWESPPGTEVCAAVGNSVDPGAPYDQTANGAVLLYSSAGSDVALLQITNMTITDAQNWGCFYAGWDNTDALTVTQTTGIHHPSADVKKISRNNDAPYFSTWSGAQVWYIDNWEQGITEPGSSGSPLFDQNGRIIGQLYGGGSACAGTVGNGDYDVYGRFGISWSGMSSYLAPGLCGAATTNDGFDPNVPTLPDDSGISGIASPTGNYCSGTFDPIVTLRNYGTNDLTDAVINYDIDGGTNNTFNWVGLLTPGTAVDVPLSTMTTTAGAHIFNSYTTLPNGNADSNPLNDDGLSNYNTTLGGESITLDFITDCWGYESAWEIVDGLGTVVQSGGNLSVIPGGGQIAGGGDPGAYGDQTTNSENFCLAVGCYDLIFYDDWGDGLDGGLGGCSSDGYYQLTDAGMNVLASLITLNFGNSETQNFCISPPCAGTVSSVTTEENCFNDCDGSITINASGATLPYSFDIGTGFQPGNIFTGLCQGTYGVTVLDGDGCTQIVSVPLSGPAEIIGTGSSTDEISGNDGTINLTVTGGVGTLDFSWSGPVGFTSTTEDINGLTSGMYDVTITDDNGCTTTVNNIEVFSQLGIATTELFRFTVYPNPANGLFNVELNLQSDEQVELILTDVSGRVVERYLISGETKFQFDISDKAAGTYYLKIVSRDFQSVVTVVNAK